MHIGVTWKVARRGKGQGPRDLVWCSSGFSWVFFLPHVYIPSGVLEEPMPPKPLKNTDKSPKKTLFSLAKGLGKGLPGQKTFLVITYPTPARPQRRSSPPRSVWGAIWKLSHSGRSVGQPGAILKTLKRKKSQINYGLIQWNFIWD